jgi:chloride channel 3/4/5
MDSSPGTSYPTEEAFELTEDGRLPGNQVPNPLGYKDGNTIDWWHELNNQRARKRQLHSSSDLRGKFLAPLLRASQTWLIVILTGIGIGAVGGWLDVLVRW